LYQEVERDVAARIRRGELAAGSLVPSEAQIRERYGVSVTTARRALLELTRQRLVVRQAGVGTFVADPASSKRLALVFAGFEASRWRSAASSIGELVGGVSDAAWRHESDLALIRQDQPLDVAYLNRLVRQGSADGLLLRIAGDVQEALVDLLEEAAFPHVFIRRYLRGRPVNAVVPADDAGMRLAVGHLARLGHRRIALMSAVPDMILTRDRVRGYRAAVDGFALDRDDRLVALAEYYSADRARELTLELLSRPRALRPTGVVADAVMVPGVYDAAAALGARIPADLAVVGYDDAPEARTLRPRLTAVHASHYEIGQVATEVLLERIGGGARPPRQVFVEPALEIKDSCGAGGVVPPIHPQGVEETIGGRDGAGGLGAKGAMGALEVPR
jgi:DNA-binding LacI/PurR family transcriptional regulator